MWTEMKQNTPKSHEGDFCDSLEKVNSKKVKGQRAVHRDTFTLSDKQIIK